MTELNGNNGCSEPEGDAPTERAELKTRGSVESEFGPDNAYRKLLVKDMRDIHKDRPDHKEH